MDDPDRAVVIVARSWRAIGAQLARFFFPRRSCREGSASYGPVFQRHRAISWHVRDLAELDADLLPVRVVGLDGLPTLDVDVVEDPPVLDVRVGEEPVEDLVNVVRVVVAVDAPRALNPFADLDRLREQVLDADGDRVHDLGRPDAGQLFQQERNILVQVGVARLAQHRANVVDGEEAQDFPVAGDDLPQGDEELLAVGVVGVVPVADLFLGLPREDAGPPELEVPVRVEGAGLSLLPLLAVKLAVVEHGADELADGAAAHLAAAQLRPARVDGHVAAAAGAALVVDLLDGARGGGAPLAAPPRVDVEEALDLDEALGLGGRGAALGPLRRVAVAVAQRDPGAAQDPLGAVDEPVDGAGEILDGEDAGELGVRGEPPRLARGGADEQVAGREGEARLERGELFSETTGEFCEEWGSEQIPGHIEFCAELPRSCLHCAL